MQKIVFLLVFYCIASHSILLEGAEDKLHKKLELADSLFHESMYSYSYDIYEQIFSEGYFTPRAILKMAYIKEGKCKEYQDIDECIQCLFYLYSYYFLDPTSNSREKISEISKKHELSGYEYSDVEYLKLLYIYYKRKIIFCINDHIDFCFSIVIYRVIIKKKQNLVIYGLFIVFLFLTCVVANVNISYRRGIIMADKVTLMDNPSPGSTLVSFLPKGYNLVIKDKRDVWYEVLWKNKKGYVKENNISVIDSNNFFD